MAIETFHTLISRNKRNSWLLIAVFMVLFVGIGLLIGSVWGGGNWTFSILVASIAAVVAFILIMVSYYGGASAVLSISKARPIQKSDDPQLFNVVEELSIAAGLPVPKIYLINDTAPNAFATGRDPKHAVVAITTGLRSKLKRDELQGVMAHEMSHVRNYDILFAMLMAVMVGVLVMLCDVFLRSLWFGRRTTPQPGQQGQRVGRIDPADRSAAAGDHHPYPGPHNPDGNEPPAGIPGRRLSHRTDPQPRRSRRRAGEDIRRSRSPRSRQPRHRRPVHRPPDQKIRGKVEINLQHPPAHQRPHRKDYVADALIGKPASSVLGESHSIVMSDFSSKITSCPQSLNTY